MEYCPYCAAPVSPGAKTCHQCKKSLDISALNFSYLPDENISVINKKAQRKIWLKEHSRFIWPIATLMLGFILGGVLIYGYAQLQFSGERDTLQNKIARIETELENAQNSSAAQSAGLKQTLKQKDAVIGLLIKQRQTLSRIINFTRRLAGSSVITPNSPETAKSFRANITYLKNQFEKQQEQIDALGLIAKKTFNVLPIPQLMERPNP